MKTYTTISAAFNNGKGDHLFIKDNQFICIHKNDAETRDKLESDGFRFLTYEEVLKHAQKCTPPHAPVILRTIKAKPLNETTKKPAPKYIFTSPDIYEWSDADPGL